MPSSSSDRVSLLRSAAFGWIVAALFALIAGCCGIQSLGLRTQNTLHRHDAELARTESQSLGQQLEAERILSASYIEHLRSNNAPAHYQIAPLGAPSDETASNALAFVVWNAKTQTGLLFIENLPALPSDQQFQLWITDAAQSSPINAGVFSATASPPARIVIQPAQSPANVTAFVITRERTGGAASPTGPVVATGALR
jgi:hypothetical protein